MRQLTRRSKSCRRKPSIESKMDRDSGKVSDNGLSFKRRMPQGERRPAKGKGKRRQAMDGVNKDNFAPRSTRTR